MRIADPVFQIHIFVSSNRFKYFVCL